MYPIVRPLQLELASIVCGWPFPRMVDGLALQPVTLNVAAVNPTGDAFSVTGIDEKGAAKLAVSVVEPPMDAESEEAEPV